LEAIQAEAAAQKDSANWLARNTVYSAVRLGGWNVWRKHKLTKVAKLREYYALAKKAETHVPIA